MTVPDAAGTPQQWAIELGARALGAPGLVPKTLPRA